LETAKRELKEETGFEAENWQKIGRIHTSNSVTDEEGFLFMATKLKKGMSEPEDTEELAIKKVHIREAIEMVMRDEITDSLSIAGILKAGKILGY